MEHDKIELKAFQSEHSVSTFRLPKLSREFHAFKEEMEKRKTLMSSKTDVKSEATKASTVGTYTSSCDQFLWSALEQERFNIWNHFFDLIDTVKEKVEQKGPEKEEKETKTLLRGAAAERVMKALQKVEEKKRKRALRKAEVEYIFCSF